MRKRRKNRTQKCMEGKSIYRKKGLFIAPETLIRDTRLPDELKRTLKGIGILTVARLYETRYYELYKIVKDPQHLNVISAFLQKNGYGEIQGSILYPQSHVFDAMLSQKAEERLLEKGVETLYDFIRQDWPKLFIEMRPTLFKEYVGLLVKLRKDPQFSNICFPPIGVWETNLPQIAQEILVKNGCWNWEELQQLNKEGLEDLKERLGISMKLFLIK